MSSIDFLTSTDFSGVATDFVAPPFTRFDDFGGDSWTNFDLDGTKTFPFVPDDSSWISALFQPVAAPLVPAPPQLQLQSVSACAFPQAPLSHESSSFLFIDDAPSSPEETKITPIELIIQAQPPVRVRTRTPNEIRTFCVSGGFTGNWSYMNVKSVKVSLVYAPLTRNGKVEPVFKDILGGTKVVPVKEDGCFRFNNLSLSESSTKHHEREFCLHLTAIGTDGVELLHQLSESFYAYSHKKVLQRRETVKLREISKSKSDNLLGGETIHMVGFPFKQGAEFDIVFRTPHGNVRAHSYEFFSESVLYFQVPAYPVAACHLPAETKEIKVAVVATNEGKLFSNPLEFTYIVHSS